MSDNKDFDFNKNNIDDEIIVSHITNVIDDDYEESPQNSTESEVELDPDVNNMLSDDNSASEYSPESEANYEEALPPIMPQIEKKSYKPWKKEKGNRGAKVFALVLSFLIVASGFMTAGYFLGNNANFDNSTPSVDLATKPQSDAALTVSQVFNEVDKSVVGIYVYNSGGIISTATGVIYSKDGYVVTNDHIYSGATNPKFKIYTNDGTMYSADFVAGDTRSDLAVLKIKDAQNLTPAVFGNSDELVVGETVIAVGRPNGATEDSIASEGVVSDKSRRVAITSSYTGNYIQTDTAINPGSSGGALCNIYGQVVGITSAKIVGDEYEGIGFAIPTKLMKKNIELLIEHQYVKGRAKLGISYTAIDALGSEMENLPTGLKIATVDETSPLHGKIAVGDIITKVGGVEITSSSVILDVIDSKTAGDSISISVYSVERKTTFNLTVELLEDSGGSSYNKTTSSDNQNSNNSKDDNEGYNKDEFNFPNGD